MSVSDTFAFISFALINNIKFVLLIVLVSNKAFFLCQMSDKLRIMAVWLYPWTCFLRSHMSLIKWRIDHWLDFLPLSQWSFTNRRISVREWPRAVGRQHWQHLQRCHGFGEVLFKNGFQLHSKASSFPAWLGSSLTYCHCPLWPQNVFEVLKCINVTVLILQLMEYTCQAKYFTNTIDVC